MSTVRQSSPMVAMSRAIRETTAAHGGAESILEITDEALDDFVVILGAFLSDFRAEQTRRKSGFYGSRKKQQERQPAEKGAK